jgi:hypothetical protein
MHAGVSIFLSGESADTTVFIFVGSMVCVVVWFQLIRDKIMSLTVGGDLLSINFENLLTYSYVMWLEEIHV